MSTTTLQGVGWLMAPEELDAAATGVLVEELKLQPSKTVVLDMSGVMILDSISVRALLKVHWTFVQADRELLLFGIHGLPLKELQVCELDSVFHLVE